MYTRKIWARMNAVQEVCGFVCGRKKRGEKLHGMQTENLNNRKERNIS